MNGFYRATVVDINDPDGANRVRLLIPQVFGSAVTGWASPLLMKTEVPPALGEQVFAAFEGENTSYPVYLWYPALGVVVRPGSAALATGSSVHATPA